MDKPNIANRKLEHIRIVMEEDVEPLPSPFASYRLPYRALPEINLHEVDTRTQLLGRALAMPLIISSMTGGPQAAGPINRHLALAAQQRKVALALGSMRICLKDPKALASFQVRRYCPDVPLLANLGLVQLNYGVDARQLNELVDMVEADGIYLHLNALQEAVQPEGDTRFKGLTARLAEVINKVKVPVFVKEVGCGIDPVSAKMLAEVGVQWLDVAGAGGTSWSQVEGHRREDRLGHVFRAVGIPTDEALLAARHIENVTLIASGGLRTGLHMAIALTLGARFAASAKPFLGPALESDQAVIAEIDQWHRELRVAMFACGAADLNALYQIQALSR